MSITVAKLGSPVKHVNLSGGCVDDALTSAGFSMDGLEVRVNGNVVAGNHPVNHGDIVTLVPVGGIRGEATVPIGGDRWRVHQNDPDEIFPSNFHAHNQVRNETLDLYTGNVYDPHTKKLLRKLPAKRLQALLRKLPQRLTK